MQKSIVLVALFLFSTSVFAGNTVLWGHEFVPAQEESAANEELAAKLKEDREFVKNTEAMGFDKAVSTLKKIVEQKSIHPDTRDQALRLLLLRFERSSGKHARALEKYLGGKLRSRQEPLEEKKKIYDSLAGEHTRAVPFLVSVAADRSVHDYIRFQACRDLEHVKLKPGQRQTIRTALGQILKSKTVKEQAFNDLGEKDVQELLRKF